MFKVEDKNDTMVVDMYELPMSQTYFDTDDKDTYVYFDIFFRRNPFKGGYTVSQFLHLGGDIFFL